MAETTTLICPKCRGEMRTYERNGVLVDQCEECRGIFLDRGELEQLIDAERAHEHHDGYEPRREEHRHGHEHEHEHHEDDRRGGRRRSSPGSLIADLFGGGE